MGVLVARGDETVRMSPNKHVESDSLSRRSRAALDGKELLWRI